MSSTAANRKTFIKNLMKFMETYGFDGTYHASYNLVQTNNQKLTV